MHGAVSRFKVFLEVNRVSKLYMYSTDLVGICPKSKQRREDLTIKLNPSKSKSPMLSPHNLNSLVSVDGWLTVLNK